MRTLETMKSNLLAAMESGGAEESKLSSAANAT
jgi:hypothetical protein